MQCSTLLGTLPRPFPGNMGHERGARLRLPPSHAARFVSQSQRIVWLWSPNFSEDMAAIRRAEKFTVEPTCGGGQRRCWGLEMPTNGTRGPRPMQARTHIFYAWTGGMGGFHDMEWMTQMTWATWMTWMGGYE